MGTRVLVGMSGGVDSSVALLLLQKAGYECVGATLSMTGEEDTSGAAALAERMGVEHHVVPVGEQFRACVMEDFVRVYEAGGTPNPCVTCNRTVKFPALAACADRLGCTCIATGHYARTGAGESGRTLLRKGADEKKDQSYFLWAVPRSLLSRTLFPLGDMTKAEVRALAEREGLPNASRRDSQDICFVPEGDHARFIRDFTGKSYPPGDMTDTVGNLLGRHRGLIAYTVGQRRGLGVAAGEPLYVKEKNVRENRLVLGTETALYSQRLTARHMNLLSMESLPEELSCSARVRYSRREEPCIVRSLPEGGAEVVFAQPQRAVTPGQSLVLYDGDIVIGGGIIG